MIPYIQQQATLPSLLMAFEEGRPGAKLAQNQLRAVEAMQSDNKTGVTKSECPNGRSTESLMRELRRLVHATRIAWICWSRSQVHDMSTWTESDTSRRISLMHSDHSA